MPMRLLIVEDEMIIALDLRLRLERFGHEVVGIAMNSEEALELCGKKKPDIILMDIHIKGSKDGIETTQLIQQQFNVPIVYLTGSAGEDVMQRAFKTEPFGYLIKPFSDSDLKVVIDFAIFKFQINEQLTKQQEFYFHVFSSMDEGIVTTDLAGNITFMNFAAEKILGIKTAEAIHNSVLSYFQFSARNVPICSNSIMQTVIESGQLIHLDSTSKIISCEKGERFIDGRIATLQDHISNVKGTVIVFRDVTEQRLTENRFRIFSQIIDQPLSMVYILDNEGKISFANQSSLDKTQFGLKDLVGRSFESLLTPNMIETKNSAIWQALRRAEPWQGELEIVRRDSTTYWEYAMIAPVRNANDKITDYVKISLDISDKKRMELELQTAKLQAETANRAKSNFLANISHEIRTPMNGIIGMAELLNNSPLNESQKKYIDMLKQSASWLHHILDDILDLTRIEADRFSIFPNLFNPHSVFKESLDIYTIQASQKKLGYQYFIDPKLPDALLGDIRRINQVIHNLLDNALKFTENGGVLVRILKEDKQNFPANILIEVRDTGIGINEERNDSVFEIFTQLDGSFTRRYGGTGLGLYISKQLVYLMKGEIWFERNENQGTTFFVRLPLTMEYNKKVTPSCLEDKQKTIPIKSPHLLVAEDNYINQVVIKNMLLSRGYQISVVENGQQAVDTCKENDFDLILMDILMPVMDGLEATRLIRAMKNRPVSRVPILAVTAYSNQEDRLRLLETGIDDIITKPIDSEELFTKLDQLFSAETETIDRDRSATPEIPEDLPILNWPLVLKRLNNDQYLSRMVVDIFMQDMPRQVALLEVYFEKMDLEKIVFQAHSLKTACANVGGERAAEQARQIENETTQNQDWIRLLMLKRRFRLEFDHLLEELKRSVLNNFDTDS